jgi:hypothetical protein
VFGTLTRFVELGGDLMSDEDSARFWILTTGASQFHSRRRWSQERSRPRIVDIQPRWVEHAPNHLGGVRSPLV